MLSGSPEWVGSRGSRSRMVLLAPTNGSLRTQPSECGKEYLQMIEPIIPLILCGGAGTRLWPASREGRPKQFLRLFGPYSTFQDTMKRVSERTVFGRPIVITNTQSRFLVLEQVEEIGME